MNRVSTPNPNRTGRGVRIPGFRRGRGRSRLRPYEVLLHPDRWSAETGERAEDLLEGRWSLGDGNEVPLAAPVAWDELMAHNRSRSFELHCWGPLGPALSAFDRTRDARYLRSALALALDWVRTFPERHDASPFAWYDMAVGVRAWRLGYLVDAAARAPFCTDQEVGELVRSVLTHREVLADDSLYPSHSNHGIFFAAGEAALALRFPELPGMEESGERARHRLDRLLQDQFTGEGIHREHSPGYQWMVLEALEGLRATGILADPAHRAVLDRIQAATAWFVTPAGELVMFGDTSGEGLPREDWPHLRDEHLRFALSRSREGHRPAERVRAFPASGYVVFRVSDPITSGPETEETYLAQACAFHSRTHKHADDLTFVWTDRGREILVDAGRYGYLGRTRPGSELWNDGFWYADPNRIYVESTRAHNTVEIDGRNLPRKGVTPYGSALRRWGEAAGVLFAESSVRHWGSLCHLRVLLLRPRRWLVVFDSLVDEDMQPHRLVQRFQFAPQVELEEAGTHGLVARVSAGMPPLHVVPLVSVERERPVRGVRTPRLEGWVSRTPGEMVPAWSAGFVTEDRSAQVFATLFAFGDEAPIPLSRAHPESRSREAFSLGWAQGSRTHKIDVRRPPRGEFELDYRVGVRSPGVGEDAP